MIFEFETGGGMTVLRAVFEESDNYEGNRQEGKGRTIIYSGEDITFDYQVSSIHPDILGLLCLIIFYPFIGERVLLPMPVSPHLVEAFQNRNFRNKFRFDNVDPSLEMYSGSKMAISFGGGTDSSAVRVLFPEAYLVHEAHLIGGELIPSHLHQVVNDMGASRARVVVSNQRYVSLPWGWHGWACSTATSLLMATDNDFGMILIGAPITTTLLRNGVGYMDRFRARRWHGYAGSFWQSTFNAIGIPIYSPVSGISEFSTMKICLNLVHQDQVFYCFARDGRACKRCPKCMRRDMTRAFVEPSYKPEWGKYKNRSVFRYLERKPLHQGCTYSFARDRIELPKFISDRLRFLPAVKTEWPLRVYQKTIEFCDERWQDQMRGRVEEHVMPMNEHEIVEMKNWDIRELV